MGSDQLNIYVFYATILVSRIWQVIGEPIEVISISYDVTKQQCNLKYDYLRLLWAYSLFIWIYMGLTPYLY